VGLHNLVRDAGDVDRLTSALVAGFSHVSCSPAMVCTLDGGTSGNGGHQPAAFQLGPNLREAAPAVVEPRPSALPYSRLEVYAMCRRGGTQVETSTPCVTRGWLREMCIPPTWLGSAQSPLFRATAAYGVLQQPVMYLMCLLSCRCCCGCAPAAGGCCYLCRRPGITSNRRGDRHRNRPSQRKWLLLAGPSTDQLLQERLQQGWPAPYPLGSSYLLLLQPVINLHMLFLHALLSVVH